MSLYSRWKSVQLRHLLCGVLFHVGVSAGLAQSSATINSDHAEVVAGETLTLHVTFDSAATCQHQVYLPLGNSATDQSFAMFGALAAGKNTADLTATVPLDFSGTFISNNSRYGNPALRPCIGYTVEKAIKLPTITVNIKAVLDKNSYPAAKDAALTLTQNQFLSTKAADLQALSSRIDTRVEGNARDSVELRNFLAGVIREAQVDLDNTEREYRSQLLKAEDPIPAFFADFHTQYVNLLIELKAPIPGTRSELMSSPHLLLAGQTLNTRPPESLARSGNHSGTMPIVAKATKASIDDNASAYRIVQTTGHATFHARFESFPEGATLYYKQAIELEFKEWSATTNIPGADFPLATFNFKFHKDGCADEPVKTIYPYENPDPVVSVEFMKCRKR